MKHSTLKNIVLPGIFCAACLGASVWYSVVFNHSRLIAPTDRKSTRLNSSHHTKSRMPSSA